MASEMLQVIVDMMRSRQSVLPLDADPVTIRHTMEQMTAAMALAPDVVTEPVTVAGVAAEWVSTPAAGTAHAVGSVNTHRDLAGPPASTSRSRSGTT